MLCAYCAKSSSKDNGTKKITFFAIPTQSQPSTTKKVHEPREERESRFVGTVSKTVKKGGRCLIPVFALGRAQELLLILDEYWQVRCRCGVLGMCYGCWG